MKILEFDRKDNYMWNFAVNVVDSSFHGLSISFVASTTILPLYVSYLTNNLLLIGLVATIAGSAYLIPQLFVANVVENLDKKKTIVIFGSLVLERLPFLGMAISSLFLLPEKPQLALICFFILYAWHGLGEGIVSIAWREMLAKIFPPEKRGRFFGTASFLETLMGMVGAGIATHILGSYEYPNNFTLLFALAFGCAIIATIFISFTREPPKPSSKNRISQVSYFQQLPHIIRNDTNFSNFLLNRIVFGLGRMGIGFVAVYGIENWGLADSNVGRFTTVLLFSQMISYLSLGYLADRTGHKVNIVIGIVAAILAMLFLIWATRPWWLYFIFSLMGIAFSTELLSSQVITFEFATEDRRPTYIGLASTISGIFGGISPLLGGWFASVWGYKVLFGISAVVLVIALVIIIAIVREPRLLMQMEYNDSRIKPQN